jgi:hypothetical protein
MRTRSSTPTTFLPVSDGAAEPRPEPVLEPAFAARPLDPRGQAMVSQLSMIHNLLRENLGIIEALATAVARGQDRVEIQGQVALLGSDGGLRMLQVNCFEYCRFVHGHHGLEDAAMLPRVRSANPAIGPVVDRLESDHRRVSVLLDDIEAAAQRLDEVPDSRSVLVTALETLGGHLLEHLAYEEESLAPTMSRMAGW